MRLVESEPVKSCLIVDDDESARYFSRQILEKKGYIVAEASSGAEAIRYINDSETMPQVILLDQRMPGIDGLSTLKQIRQIDGSEDIEIIIVTAFKSYQLVIDALQNGASDFIVKPVTSDSLEKLIDRALFRQRDIRKRKKIGAGSGVKWTEEGLRLQTVTQVGKTLACEMGNPLQAILGSAELMSKGEGVVRNMEKIERGVAKILEILDKFSNATSVKTAKVFMDDEMIDIRAMESIDIKRTV